MDSFDHLQIIRLNHYFFMTFIFLRRIGFYNSASNIEHYPKYWLYPKTQSLFPSRTTPQQLKFLTSILQHYQYLKRSNYLWRPEWSYLEVGYFECLYELICTALSGYWRLRPSQTSPKIYLVSEAKNNPKNIYFIFNSI